MFKHIKIFLQTILNPQTLADKESCRKLAGDILAALKPLAAANQWEIDDKIIAQLEYVVANEAVFNYFYSLIAAHLQTQEIAFESAQEDELQEICRSAEAPTCQAVSPFELFALALKIISFINALKQLKVQ